MEYLVYIKIAALIIELLKAKNEGVAPADLTPIVKMLEPIIDSKMDIEKLETEDKEAIKTVIDFLFNRGKDEKETTPDYIKHCSDIGVPSFKK